MIRTLNPRPQVRSSLAGRALLLILARALGLTVLAAPPTVAQSGKNSTTESDADQAEKAEKAKLPKVGETIVVTARKREENLQEVPVAVTVATGEQLEESAA